MLFHCVEKGFTVDCAPEKIDWIECCGEVLDSTGGVSMSKHPTNCMPAWCLAVCMMVITGGASAQTAKDLVGAWTIVSMTVEGDGKKSEPFGPNPIGTQIYDSSGRFASMVMRSDLPKVASSNRATSTPEES